MLHNGRIEISEDSTLLAALTRVCQIHKDQINTKLIIRKSMVQLMLQELNKKFCTQPYLTVLYKALIVMTYFGMFRIGEVTTSPHVVKACDIHIRINKPKLLFVLHSSKTHGRGNKTQLSKIMAPNFLQDSLCPFQVFNKYLAMRRKYHSQNEQFFVFMDGSPVKLTQYCRVIKDLIIRCGLNPSLYGVHGLHAGRASDLLDLGVSVETICKLGQWKSTSVYTYFHV